MILCYTYCKSRWIRVSSEHLESDGNTKRFGLQALCNVELREEKEKHIGASHVYTPHIFKEEVWCDRICEVKQYFTQIETLVYKRKLD